MCWRLGISASGESWPKLYPILNWGYPFLGESGKGLEVDELVEVFCQRLMLCCPASGRKTEALSIYDLFRRRPQSGLGVESSPKIQAVDDTIRRKERAGEARELEVTMDDRLFPKELR